MQTKNKKKTIQLITLGCAKNTVDSEKLLFQLKASGFDISQKDNTPDYLVINTCGFINDAKQESLDTILHYVNEKKAGKIKQLFVIGCLSERYKNELRNEIPEVDEFFGVDEFTSLLKTLRADYLYKLGSDRILSGPGHYAYLKISEGCDRTCSFCAIPLIRGRYVSRPMNEIIEEAAALANKGVKELLIIAQDTTRYGTDLYKKQNLAILLHKLTEINGIEWIKLHYTYPADFPEDVIELLADNKKLCKYIDIPFQHINDRILTSMHRKHSKHDIIKLIDLFRRKIENVAIRTTFIVGYPGENANEFKELYDFVKEIKFERLGIFKYSHEDGTKAGLLKDNVSEKIKEERYHSLMELQRTISFENNQKFLHQKIKIIIDSKENNSLIGRTMFDSPEIDNEVIIQDCNREYLIGNFAEVKIISATDYDLFGTL